MMSPTAPADPPVPGPATGSNSSITIREMAAEDASRWDDFVRNCPTATFFHLSGWKHVIENIFQHPTWFIYAETRGEIRGVLPLAQVRSRIFGNSLVSLPFCVYGGVAAMDCEVLQALETAADHRARDLGVDHLELRNVIQRHVDWPRQDIYVTFRKEILPDVEANLMAIPRKQRAMVRKGAKAGLATQIDDGIDRFFALYANNVRRHGTPALPIRYFEMLKEEFGQDCESLIVTNSAGSPVSGVLTFYFRDEVLPYYAGDTLAARDLAANDFKYWELMRRGCERSCRVFDYGRSKRGTGSFQFKKNWGFEPKPLSYEYRLYARQEIPQNNPMNPKYRAFIKLWRLLPLGIANRLGPYVVRNLG